MEKSPLAYPTPLSLYSLERNRIWFSVFAYRIFWVKDQVADLARPLGLTFAYTFQIAVTRILWLAEST